MKIVNIIEVSSVTILKLKELAEEEYVNRNFFGHNDDHVWL